MLRLIDTHDESTVHPVRNLLALLSVPHETAPRDATARVAVAHDATAPGATIVDGDVTLCDASAILVYVGRKFGRGRWLPVDAAGEARVQEWLSIASEDPSQQLASSLDIGGDVAHAVLTRFEQHLCEQAFLVGKRPTIADIASYTFIKLAQNRGVPLSEYPSVCDWLARLEQLQGFVALPHPDLTGSA